MIAALLYLQFVSMANRTLRRLKRLKQPKYLVGGIVGGLYFYFYFIRYLFGLGNATGRPALPLTSSPENRLLFEGLGAALLMLMVVLGWVLPRERVALAFTEAEVAFLFPAPLSRRGLIHYKLLRSQAAILFTSLFLMLLSNRMGGKVWIQVIGWWMILSTLNLHLLGASFARTRLLDRGITNWQRRIAVLSIVAAVLAVVLIWAGRSLPSMDWSQLQSAAQLKLYLTHLLDSGPAPWLLLPFRLVVRPYLAPTGLDFLRALLPAAGVLLLHYLWVIRSNVAFEEASVEASRRLAEKVAAIRAGNWAASRQAKAARRAPFVLRPNGPAPIAFLWKNLISAGQAFTWRVWLVFALAGGGAALGISQSARYSNLAAVLGMMLAMFLVWSVLFGPQILRQDFRQDLILADMLKLYPLRGWQVALGELLAPACILSAIQWGLLLLGLLLLTGQSVQGLTRPWALAGALGMAVVLPFSNLLTLQIPNAAVLLFPSWVNAGKEGAQGIEATGQRIIFMLAQLFVFLLSLVPAAVVFGALFFAFKLLVPPALAMVVGAFGAALVLAVEAFVGVVLLGKLFERLDLSTEHFQSAA